MKKRRKLSVKRVILTFFAAVLIAVVIFAARAGYLAGRYYLAYNGTIDPPPVSVDEYSVHGVDVSRYQGNIDWDMISSQGIDFAFIKATEGTDYVDPQFADNWQNVQTSGIYAGAYHYYSFGSNGAAQAENFKKNVPKTVNILPPVVDFELTNEDLSVEAGYVQEHLSILLDELEKSYGVKPIIYTTPKAYIKYLLIGYSDYTFWMRNTYYEPSTKWSFWQYSDQGRLEGYDGDQQYIDLNVYKGDMNSFLREFNLTEKNQGV